MQHSRKVLVTTMLSMASASYAQMNVTIYGVADVSA